MKNIEIFELATGHILAKLYENHPLGYNFYEKDILEIIGKEAGDEDQRKKFFEATIEFLNRTDMINGATIGYSYPEKSKPIAKATLGVKGYHALSQKARV